MLPDRTYSTEQICTNIERTHQAQCCHLCMQPGSTMAACSGTVASDGTGALQVAPGGESSMPCLHGGEILRPL